MISCITSKFHLLPFYFVATVASALRALKQNLKRESVSAILWSAKYQNKHHFTLFLSMRIHEKVEYEEQIPSKEKPSFLYHGSPHKDIEEFEPRISKGTGEEFGAMVYATPDLATASVFLTEIEKEWSAGRLNDTFYTVIPLSREEFIKNDKGGYIYVLPSATFESDSERGLGEYEWASKEKVKPLKKIEYASALDAMLENGVQIYFVDDETFRQIKKSNDHGLSILRNLESENQRRDINIKLLKKQEKPKNASIPE